MEVYSTIKVQHIALHTGNLCLDMCATQSSGKDHTWFQVTTARVDPSPERKNEESPHQCSMMDLPISF